jgi:hypothetical protein
MCTAVGVCCVQDLKEQDGEVVSSGKKHEHHKGSKAAAAKYATHTQLLVF